MVVSAQNIVKGVSEVEAGLGKTVIISKVHPQPRRLYRVLMLRYVTQKESNLSLTLGVGTAPSVLGYGFSRLIFNNSLR